VRCAWEAAKLYRTPAGRERRGHSQFGTGKIKTRLLAWSAKTAWFVNWSIAMPNCAEPGNP